MRKRAGKSGWRISKTDGIEINGRKDGNRITISRIPKGMYTVKIKTVKGEKSLKFNLR